MINSWDCFDTILARYYHRPISIFEEIQIITTDYNFTKNRIAAEQKASIKNLEEIYKYLPGHDKDLEVEIEKKYTYPIKENFDRIQDGDIIISDMYLSSAEILSILKYHGLNKDITVYSTYGGKATGEIWDIIKANHDIRYHIGDNIHSDNLHAQKYGISTLYCGASSLTSQEKLIERYNPYLAYWIKFIRLCNPYFIPYQQFYFHNNSISHYYGIYWIKQEKEDISILEYIDENNKEIILRDKFENLIYYISKDNQTIKINNESNKNIQHSGHWIEQPINTKNFDEKILWTEQASYNISLLINSSYLLPKNIVFSYRDCYYWKKIYDSIFNTNTPILESCRNSYYYPYNEEYINYVLNITKNKTIVDLHGTGYSSSHFFHNQQTKQDILFISEHADENRKNINIKSMNLCFDRIFPENLETNRLHHNRVASRNGLRCCSGTVLEKFNIPPKLGPLIAWNGESVRKKSEHNQDICNIFDKCVDTSITASSVFKDKIQQCEDLTEVLLKQMNKPNYTDSVIHSLWDKTKNIKITS
jgi:hypothetical protein